MYIFNRILKDTKYNDSVCSNINGFNVYAIIFKICSYEIFVHILKKQFSSDNQNTFAYNKLLFCKY